jgi:exopolysaccharide production protein ExoQ
MIQQSVLIASILFTIYLVSVDVKKTARPWKALMVPLIWMFLSGTREFSAWFQIEGRAWSPDAFKEGNPVDAAVHFLLILCGVIIISRRQQLWGKILSQNSWILMFFIFGAFGILWSDYSYIAFKRWIKAFGTLVMALVVLTEDDPSDAFNDLLRRLAIFVIPLSVILCKFYPEYGRVSLRGTWSYSGVAAGKNLLGMLCLLSGIYFIPQIFSSRTEIEHESYPSKIYSYWFLGMTAYLLYLTNSATSQVCMIVFLFIFFASRFPTVKRRPKTFILSGLMLAIVIGFLNETFHLKEAILSMVGRNENLTSRHPMWEELILMNPDPMFGVGYESFWLGERMKAVWVNYEGIIQSHNGYLETYLNLGIIGVILMIGTIVSGFKKAIKYLSENYDFAFIKISIIIVVALYNWTEASFYGTSTMFMLFILVAFYIPKNSQSTKTDKNIL